MTRPPLTPQTSPDDFTAFYWLKEELVGFCRQVGLSTAGSKQALAQRIHDYLSKKPGQPAATPKKKTGGRMQRGIPQHLPGRMPESFTRETIIGPGFRCSQALRAFFEAEIGPSFHFNAVMRDFIQNGQGKTLQQAIDAWQQAQQAPADSREIDSQFEYNRYIREYFADNAGKGKTLQDAIAAWKVKKSLRKDG